LHCRSGKIWLLCGLFPIDDWKQYAVGIVSDADGVILGSDGTATIPTNFSIEVNNYVEYLNWCIENEPTSTALLPFKVAGETAGIVIEDLKKITADVSVATGTSHYTNAVQ